jgi:cytochrome bd-type quinol oxidase subunit 2
MAPSARAGKSPVTVRRVIAVVLLLAAIVGTLGVPIYARSTPQLGPFPFFYWYQLMLVPVVAILCWLCTVLVKYRPPAGRGPADDGEAGQ